MTIREGEGTSVDDVASAPQSADDDPAAELAQPDRLLRYFDESANSDEAEGDGPLPQITSLADGIRVDERRVGRAVARWVLQVRCDCGRRWFEADALDTATCPRCGVLVYVDMDARSSRR